jgi:hypothetical protein
MSMRTEEFGNIILGRVAGCGAKSDVNQALFVAIDFDVVHREKHDRRCGAGAFVAIKRTGSATTYSASFFMALPNHLWTVAIAFSNFFSSLGSRTGVSTSERPLEIRSIQTLLPLA